MTDLCVACGKPIVLVRANPRVISLAMKWVHVSRRANRSHHASPERRCGMAEFKPGDRVYVIDPGLAQLRAIMRRATGVEPAPNHHGTVDEVWDDGLVLISFDSEDGPGQGSCAPYPPESVRHLEAEPGAGR